MAVIKNKVPGALIHALALAGIMSSGLRYLPRRVKWLMLFIIALNYQGVPFLWHARLAWPGIKTLIRTRLHLSGAPGRLRALTKISPIGTSPYGMLNIYHAHAGLADCDMYGHLSNSCYAKNMDFARMKAAVESFSGFISAGGGLALLGSYYQFVKEIPIFSDYEVRVTHVCWEHDKWFYLVVQFVTYPKGHKHQHKPDAGTIPNQGLGQPLIKAMAPTFINETLSHTSSEEKSTADSPGSNTPLYKDTIFKLAPLPKGATLHAIAVSVQCFKHGRITVPPRVGYIASGFSAPATAADLDGIPARWKQVQEWRKQKGKLESLIRGGWKEGTDEEKRFWDFEECEEEANQAAEKYKGMRLLMDEMKL